MTLVCGVDEAGRGPVIGPLVIAGVCVDEESTEKLKNIGVKESKLLTPAQRERMFDQIKEIVNDYHIVSVSAKEVDEALESPSLNLNWLEAEKTVEIINKLKPEKAIIDAPSNNIEAYTDYIKERLTVEAELQCEHKADLNYIEAAAGSILAKVTRDRAIEDLKKEYGDFGSGYPSDPKTAAFLKDNIQLDIFRKTWESYKRVAREQSQGKLSDF